MLLAGFLMSHSIEIMQLATFRATDIDDLILLLRGLIDDMPRRAVVLWALDLAEEAVQILEEKYPLEKRPRIALTMTRMWASGEVKMPIAKRAILDCHAVGFPIYDLTAMIRENGIDNCDELIQERLNYYIEQLAYWKGNYKYGSEEWARFLTD